MKKLKPIQLTDLLGAPGNLLLVMKYYPGAAQDRTSAVTGTSDELLEILMDTWGDELGLDSEHEDDIYEFLVDLDREVRVSRNDTQVTLFKL
jgi:hypothetical protein